MIFSSRIIPGNEKAIGRLQNALVRLGVEIVTEEDHFVHVSGHPARDELVRMYQMVRPQIAVPVHGEARHLIAHAELAAECQVQRAARSSRTAMWSGSTRERRRPSSTRCRSGRSPATASGLLPLDGAALQQTRSASPSTAASSPPWSSIGAASLAAPPQITLIGLVEKTEAEAAARRACATRSTARRRRTAGGR